MKTHNKKSVTISKPQETELANASSNTKKYAYFLALFAFFLFANTLGHLYNLDDAIVTNEHPLTSKGLSAIGEIITSPYYSDTMGYAYGYRPIVHLSFAFQHELFGPSVAAGHFINVLLFSLSVVLFFKLLLAWLPKNQLNIACIATLIFAAHPLHSEVVSSLKNRDELLAFLFIILAGLAFTKYIVTTKIKHLFSIGIFVTLAMLSKKSMYPLTAIFPIALLLLNKTNVKELTIASCTLIIPAAIISAEFNVGRTFTMIFLPLFVIYFTHFIIFSCKKESTTGVPKNNTWIPILILIAALTGAYLYFHLVVILLLLVPVFIWLYISNDRVATIATILILSIFEVFQSNVLNSYLVLLIATSYGIYLWHKKEKIQTWLPLVIIGLGVYLYPRLDFVQTLFAVASVLLFWIVYKKPQIGVISSVVMAGIIFAVTGKINALTFFIIAIPTAYLLSTTVNRLKTVWKYAPAFAISISLLFLAYTKLQTVTYNSNITPEKIGSLNNIVAEENKALEGENNPIKEGRQLQYAENTLVAKHSGEERVATGLATLGTYLKLHFLPTELSFYYGFAKTKTVDFSNIGVWISLLAHLGLIFLAIWQREKRPILTISIAWYIGSILLFSNWIELVAGMVADRLTFTASAGFALFIAAIVTWIKPNISLKNLGVVGWLTIGILVLFSARTVVRNTDWKDTNTLMTHDINHLKNSAQANSMYGTTLMRESIQNTHFTPNERLNMQKLAITHFEQALKICPDYFNVYVDLGRAAKLTQQFEKSINAFNNALKIKPTYFEPYNHLLEIYKQEKNAEKYHQTAKRLFDQVKEPRTYIIYAMGEFQLNNYEACIAILNDGLKQFPNDTYLLQNKKLIEDSRKK